jgi:D-alanyl-D-alanine carboxypeptidase
MVIELTVNKRWNMIFPSSSSHAVSSSQTVSSSQQDSSSETSDSSDTPKVIDNSGELADDGLLMLVNKDNKLPENYSPDLVKLDVSYFYSSSKNTHFDSRAAESLKQFINDGRKAGYSDLCILSGYRTYQYQKNNFDRHVKQFEAQGQTLSQAKASTEKIVAPPGTSEHETGLAADIITKSWYNKTGTLDSSFENTKAFKWLYENSAKYGFILRYPEDKVEKTGYSYEPWHYRYVGVDNAKAIVDGGCCLEEYIEKIK